MPRLPGGEPGAVGEAPSFDQIAQARSGFAQHAGGGPGAKPEVPYPGIADHVGAMNFAAGIMAALFVRERTGKGQRVDVSLLGSQLALQTAELQHAFHYGEQRAREFRSSPTAGHYRCADGRWLMVVGIDQKFWPRLCEALGMEHLATDERFARVAAGSRTARSCKRSSERRSRRGPPTNGSHACKRSTTRQRSSRAMKTSALTHRSLRTSTSSSVNIPGGGLSRRWASTFSSASTPGAVGLPAPALGAHTRSVLAEFGIEDGRVQSLIEGGVLGAG